MVPILYGRQAIRVVRRAALLSGPLRQNGYVISGYFAVLTNFRFVAVLRQTHKQQIVWVLYGHASRAIRMG